MKESSNRKTTKCEDNEDVRNVKNDKHGIIEVNTVQAETISIAVLFLCRSFCKKKCSFVCFVVQFYFAQQAHKINQN